MVNWLSNFESQFSFDGCWFWQVVISSE
jgi:hypothetical protein